VAWIESMVARTKLDLGSPVDHHGCDSLVVPVDGFLQQHQQVSPQEGEQE